MADVRTDASITIGGDIGPLNNAFGEAQALVKSKMEGIAGDVTSALKGIGASIAAAFAFKELKDFVNGVAETRAHLQELAESTGTTVENLSAMSTVAKVVGASIDDAAAAMEKLIRGLATGDGETGKAANALDYLGIKARNVDGSLKDAGDLYQEIALKFAHMGDGAGKTALAIDLFGKAGAAQVPLLNALGEAGGGVAKVTEEQARTAQDYERDLNKLEIQLASTKKTIAGEMIPAADDFVKALLGAITETNGLNSAVKDLANDGSLETFGRNAAVVLGSVLDLAMKVGQGFKFIGTGIAAGAAQMAAENQTQRDAIAKAWSDDMKTMFSTDTIEDRLHKLFALRDEAKKIDFGSSKYSWDKADYTGTSGKGNKGRLEDTSKAEYAVAKAQLEAAAAIRKEYLKETQEAYDDSYKHNLISIRDYYDERTTLEQAALQAEMDAKRLEIAANEKAQSTVTTDRERLNLKAEEIKLTGQLTVMQAQYANAAVVNNRAATEAERQRAAALREVAVASQVNVGNSQVAMDRIALDTRRQLRQTSDAQAIQEQKGFEDRLTAIQAQAVRDRIEIERAGTNDPAKIASLNAQLEQIERDHQQRITDLDAQATVEREKYATEAASRVQDTFATFFNDLTDRSKKLSDVFKDLGNNLLKAFNDIASKRLAEQLFGAGTSGGGVVSDLMKQLFPPMSTPAKGATPATPTTGGIGGFFDSLKGFFGGSSAPAKPAATTEQNDVAGLAALDSAAMSTSSSMTELSKTGIGGMFKSAGDWITKQISGTVASQAANVAQEAATSAMTALTQAAYNAATALSSIQVSGGSSSGSSMGIGNLFGAVGGSSGGSTASASQIAQADSMASSASTLSAQGSIPWLATGTNYVPHDMLAMIHEGEAVVPAKYNPATQARVAPIHQTINVPESTSRASAAQIGMAVFGSTAAASRRYA